MPIYKQGDYWSDTADYKLITTNSVVKKNGALVMGRGLAKQARDAIPGIDKQFGQRIQWFRNETGHWTYGLLLPKLTADTQLLRHGNFGFNSLGAFQVKYNFSEAAILELIVYSTGMLAERARSEPDKTFALNFPGIGNGGLEYDTVKPVVDLLPDNVNVWTFD